MGRVACVWVPCFAAAAAERCEPALVERPLAIVRGAPPVTRVIEANAAARERGVGPGLTESEARARCPELHSRPWSEERTTAARLALLDALFAVSPRIEDADAGLVYVDVAGLERLVGDARTIGERLARQARAIGLTARVAIAGSRAAAWVVARAHPRVTVVAAADAPAVLAPVPVGVLDLPDEVTAALERWGVRTVGALAALPRDGLALRLGPAGLRAHDLALGLDRDPFRPWTPPPFWVEAQELEWEIGDLDALAVALRAVLGRLAARLGAAHLATDELTVELRLDSTSRHGRTIGLAYPVLDVDTMLRLVRLDLEAHPPGAPVVGITVTARPVRTEAGQGALWRPALPAHRDLAALVARLVELVGPANCGAPALADSHRADAVTLATFLPPAAGLEPDDRAPALGAPPEPRLVLRRLSPPRPVEVVVVDERPARVRRGTRLRRVVTCAGPWRTSGEWWDTRAWMRDEWDALLDDGTLGRLAHDRTANTWTLDAIYD